MAINRFTCEKYASVELNRCAFLKTGNVVSQLPLGAAFVASAPCENGMVLNCDKSKGALSAPAAASDVIGLVYTAEKEYGPERGLNSFCQVGGDYPRVGVLVPGDTVTTNCFAYDTTEFTNNAAVVTALGALSTTPLFLKVAAGGNALVITATAPTTGFKATVVAKTTVPNGEIGIKYNVVRV